MGNSNATPAAVPVPMQRAGFDSKARMEPHECPVFLVEKGRHFHAFVDSYMVNPNKKTLSDTFDLLNSLDNGKAKPHYDKALKFEKNGDVNGLHKQLIWLYTTAFYYREMNSCLRTDHPVQMENLAPLIFNTREAFRSDASILKPFEGKMLRGLNGLSQLQIVEFIPDSEFFFPAFTSGSANESTGEGFAKHPHWGGRGLPVKLEIRCYGLELMKRRSENAQGAWYIPCDVQPESINDASTAEIVIPPYTKFRTVNVKKDESLVHVWLETVEFPSVWESIEKLDSEEFSKFAEGNPEVVAAHGCEDSIINKVVERVCAEVEAAQAHGVPCAVEKHGKHEALEEPGGGAEQQLLPGMVDRVAGMLKVCANKGANINEVDPKNGMTPLYRIAKVAARVDPLAQHLLDNVVEVADVLMKCGANPFMKLDKIDKNEDYGKCVHELVGEKMPAMKNVLENPELFPHTWEYWVDDKVDGKADGWYPYDSAASPQVDATFIEWRKHGAAASMQVCSGMFTYSVDFAGMSQRNTKTHKCRQIRRKIDGKR